METKNEFFRFILPSSFLAFSTLFFLLIFSNCEPKITNHSYSNYIDPDIPVYGPYTAIKLPIKNGVQITNPIQISLGPGGLIFASNQTGEIRSGIWMGRIEDTALLYCNVNDFGLRSPTGFAYRGDTVYIRLPRLGFLIWTMMARDTIFSRHP